MKIHVTSASGQLGGKIVRSLLDQGTPGADLSASARHPEKIIDLASFGITSCRADYDDPQSMVTAFEGCDVLMLVTGPAGVEPRIQQHFNTIEAAKVAGVNRIVFTSFATAIPTSRFLMSPFYLYAESKLRLSGLGWTILRNGMYLDPVADWVPHLREMGRLPYPVKSGKIAYISRDDLARAAAAACLDNEHSGKLYELTGPEALSMSQLAEAISAATGQIIPFDGVTEQEFGDICRAGDENLPDAAVDILNSIYRAADNQEFATVTDHVERLTGTAAETARGYLSRVVQ